MKKGQGTPKGGAAMSFEEIGQELGMTRGGAWMAYKSAMRKLRKEGRLRELQIVLALARSKDRPGLTGRRRDEA